MGSGKRTNVLLWTSAAAAVTGILAVAAIVKWKEKTRLDQGVTKRLRSIQEVLADCYTKINEIEDHIPTTLVPVAPHRAPLSANKAITNGSPLLDI